MKNHDRNKHKDKSKTDNKSKITNKGNVEVNNKKQTKWIQIEIKGKYGNKNKR